jgi:hypothetical protein
MGRCRLMPTGDHRDRRRRMSNVNSTSLWRIQWMMVCGTAMDRAATRKTNRHQQVESGYPLSKAQRRLEVLEAEFAVLRQ